MYGLGRTVSKKNTKKKKKMRESYETAPPTFEIGGVRAVQKGKKRRKEAKAQLRRGSVNRKE